MTIPAETLKKVDAFWAGYFGCRPEDLNSSKTLVFTHVALKGYDGALVFRHADACIVSVPQMVPEIERKKLRKGAPQEVFDAGYLARVFVCDPDKVVGPAWLAIADSSMFHPVKTAARPLGDADEDAVKQLADACGEHAWKQSKLLHEGMPLFGLFAGKELIAAAGYVTLGDIIAYMGVVTHPGHRGRGNAKAVMTTALADAFQKGLVAQWRTSFSNDPGISLAQTVGFEQYASTLDVHLIEDEF